VDKLVFDSEDEMRKIAGVFPSARLFLRLHAEDPTSLVRLSDKFGAHAPEAQSLLRLAATLGLQVIGLCFHMGSAASDPAAYTRAIKMCRTIYDYNQRLERSHPISVVDIGGGFTAANFEAVSRAVSAAIRSEFGNIESVRWMAEPGRFFANEVFSLVCRVIGVGRRPEDIFVNDGIYQNFLNTIIEQCTPAPILLDSLELPRGGRPEGQAHTIWGQTCCGQDKINSLCLLPRAARRGDHLYYPNVGGVSTVTFAERD
jgi:ornithine decarboxylase